jgi:hypothetical protein
VRLDAKLRTQGDRTLTSPVESPVTAILIVCYLGVGQGGRKANLLRVAGGQPFISVEDGSIGREYFKQPLLNLLPVGVVMIIFAHSGLAVVRHIKVREAGKVTFVKGKVTDAA